MSLTGLSSYFQRIEALSSSDILNGLRIEGLLLEDHYKIYIYLNPYMADNDSNLKMVTPQQFEAL